MNPPGDVVDTGGAENQAMEFSSGDQALFEVPPLANTLAFLLARPLLCLIVAAWSAAQDAPGRLGVPAPR